MRQKCRGVLRHPVTGEMSLLQSGAAASCALPRPRGACSHCFRSSSGKTCRGMSITATVSDRRFGHGPHRRNLREERGALPVARGRHGDAGQYDHGARSRSVRGAEKDCGSAGRSGSWRRPGPRVRKVNRIERPASPCEPYESCADVKLDARKGRSRGDAGTSQHWLLAFATTGVCLESRRNRRPARAAVCLVSLRRRGSERLQRCVAKLVTRHEILRTVFRRQAGMKVPFQVVLETAEVGWEHRKFSAMSPADRKREFGRFVRNERRSRATRNLGRCLSGFLSFGSGAICRSF